MLLRTVVNIGYFVVHFVLLCNFGDVISPIPVLNILELRMLLALIHLQQHLPYLVYIRPSPWKPWNHDRVRLAQSNPHGQQILLRLLDVYGMIRKERKLDAIFGSVSFLPVFTVGSEVAQAHSVTCEYIANSRQSPRSIIGDGSEVWILVLLLLKLVSLKYLPVQNDKTRLVKENMV